MSRESKATTSSGNVFADLRLRNPEDMLLKAQLALRIAEAMKRRKLTQHGAAELLGIDQPKVSKLVRGQLYSFSSDQLLRFLTALGQDVEIVVRAPRRGKGTRGRLTVRAA
jgi:predicted XRE-type DNA-binding protein